MSYRLNEHIQRWIDIVEGSAYRTCEDQKLLVKHVKKCFTEEDIYVNDEQLEKYLGLAKYFPYDRIFEWQEFVIALHDCTYWRECDLPRWPDLFCMIGRGAGKDGTIALEAVDMMSPYNGIRGYDVDICANNKDQAMRPVKDVIEAFEMPQNIKKLKRHFYWTKEEVIGLKTHSILRGRTNSPKGKDGLRSGIVIFNEIHQYLDYKNIDVFTTGLGKKRHPRRSYYTTNGDVREGPLDDLLETSDAILRGGEADGGLLPFICRLDNKEEVHDERNWTKSNPSLPYLPHLQEEMRKEYKDWVRAPHMLPAFMTKRMNIPENSAELAVTKWENIAATKKEQPDLKGRSCTCGIDFSKLTDFASVNLHFKEGDLRYDLSHSWLCIKSSDIPRMKCPWQQWAKEGRLTVVDDVEIHPSLLVDYIAEMKRYYNITKIAVDDFRFALITSELARIGFDTKAKKNIKLVKPNDIIKVASVIDSCFANQYFIWGDAPELRWAVNNTKLIRYRRKPGSEEDQDMGNYVYGKIEGKSRKTDPFLALVASMTIEDELNVYRKPVTPDLGIFTY